MSIWCSWPHVGHNNLMGEPVRGGEVRTYAEGFSNHYPTTDNTHELPAGIGLARIPVWCVPGHDDTDIEGIYGPWVRLSVFAEESLHWWGLDPAKRPTKAGPVHASVVLDEAAALQLYHDLGDWLMQPKVHPEEEADA